MSRRTMFFDIRPVAWIMLALLSVTTLGASPQVMQRVVGDIQYFTGGEADPDFHTLDLYLPDGESDLPLIFFVPTLPGDPLFLESGKSKRRRPP